MTGDIGHDVRWPRWGPRAAELGLGSVVTKGLLIRDQTAGTLVLYANRLDAYGKRDLEIAEFFARYASAALATAHNRDAMLAAAETRQTIGIAEGILMERHQLGAEAAFSSLRRQGADDHTTLLEAAVQIASDMLAAGPASPKPAGS